MHLTFINGSPRGVKSNTGRLMDHFFRGFRETEGNTFAIEYIAKHRNDPAPLVRIFESSGTVIIGFPLYADAMPGSVKVFFEALSALMGRQGNPDLGFVIQCGFPETYQNRFVERYCDKICAKDGMPLHGLHRKGRL